MAVDIAGSVVAVVILICMEYLLPNTADNYRLASVIIDASPFLVLIKGFKVETLL